MAPIILPKKKRASRKNRRPVPNTIGGMSPSQAVKANAAIAKKNRGKQSPRGVRRLQKKLSRLGYSIKVDGIMGPKTRAAARHFRKHDGERINIWNRKQREASGKSAPSGGGSAGGGGGRGGRGGRGRRGGGGGGGKGGQFPKGFKPLNPNKLASALTKQQFGSAISQLKQDIKLAEQQEKQNIADLESWYSRLDDEVTRIGQEQASGIEAAEADFESAAEGLARAFGGGASVAAPATRDFAISTRGFLEDLGASEQSFTRDMQAIFQGQAVEAKRRERQGSQQGLDEMRSSLVNLKRERGAAATVNRFQAQEQSMQQAAALQNLILGSQMAGVDLALAQADLRGKRQENKIKAIQIQDLKQQIKGEGGGAIPPFNQIDPGTRSKIEDRIRTGVVGPGGGFLEDPQQALNAMGNALRRLGWNPKNDKTAKAFRDSILRSALAKSHSGGSWKKWRIINNRLISPRNKVVYRLS